MKVNNMSTKEARIKEIQDIIIKNVNATTSESMLGRMYSEAIGCYLCPIQLQCNKQNCSGKIEQYIRKGM